MDGNSRGNELADGWTCDQPMNTEKLWMKAEC